MHRVRIRRAVWIRSPLTGELNFVRLYSSQLRKQIRPAVNQSLVVQHSAAFDDADGPPASAPITTLSRKSPTGVVDLAERRATV